MDTKSYNQLKLAAQIMKTMALNSDTNSAYPALLTLACVGKLPDALKVDDSILGLETDPQVVQNNFPENWENVCAAIDVLIEGGYARFDDEEGVVIALENTFKYQYPLL